jgi:hypothetical protein
MSDKPESLDKEAYLRMCAALDLVRLVGSGGSKWVSILQYISRDLEPMSKEAKAFFADMSLADWQAWTREPDAESSRYQALVKMATANTTHIDPPLTWWESEFVGALIESLGVAASQDEGERS